MSPFDAIYAALDAARTVTQTAEKADNAEFDAWQQTLAGIKAQAATQAAADAATIADLKHQIDVLEHPQPPPAPIKWGASVYQYGTPPESYAQALARNEATFGATDPLIRHYGATPKWPGVTGVHPLVYSFKLPPAEVVAGTHDVELKAFAAVTPTMYTAADPADVCYWHEPENDGLDPVQYRAAWQHIADIFRASGKPIRTNLILMDWTLDPRSRRNWQDYYQAGAVDLIAWDAYVWGPNTNFAAVLDKIRAIAVSTGKPWAVAETGVGAVQFPDPAVRNAKLTELGKELSDPANLRPAYVTYFDTTFRSSKPPAYDWNISRTPAAATAWKAGRTG